MSLSRLYDTITAISTPLGTSALAMVRISGEDAIGIVAGRVSEPHRLLVLRSGTSLHTTILTPADGALDDVVISVHRAPRSYTGEDLVEITSHGSPVIAETIQALLIAGGARSAEPGEFSRRALMHGKIALADAEQISARTHSTSVAALKATEQAIREKYRRLREAHDLLITLVAELDAEIDFGESDHIALTSFGERRDRVLASLETMLRETSDRQADSGYIAVALTGPPNVGKSSLFNALLRRERSIVSDRPGTTRDFVESFIELGGFRMKLIDTAGLRTADESIEAQGITMGAEAAARAEIVLYLTTPEDRSPEHPEGSHLVHNKCDLDQYQAPLAVSASTGEGLSALEAFLESELRARSAEHSAAALSAEDRSRLTQLLDRLRDTRLDGLEPTLLAEELRDAAEIIAGCLGIRLGEASLEHIFTKMCIGK